MSGLVLSLSLMCGLVLCATVVSLFAAYRAHRILKKIDARTQSAKPQKEVDLQPLRESLESLFSQVHDLQRQPHIEGVAGVPKAGFNLNKRSQALRMHRRGEGPEQIAAALGMPRQEVELLFKVHAIVIQNV